MTVVDEIPHFIKMGFDKRICAFIEIARHPEGLSVNELMPKLECTKMMVWCYLKPLIEAHLIAGRKSSRNGRRAKIFKATPYGIDRIHVEMKSLCELFAAVRAEMIEK